MERQGRRGHMQRSEPPLLKLWRDREEEDTCREVSLPLLKLWRDREEQAMCREVSPPPETVRRQEEEDTCREVSLHS